jgi:hypothetical protein
MYEWRSVAELNCGRQSSVICYGSQHLLFGGLWMVMLRYISWCVDYGVLIMDGYVEGILVGVLITVC